MRCGKIKAITKQQTMSFGFYKLKTFLLFSTCLFFALALPLYPANAFVEWLGKVIIGGILWIICMIPILIGAGLTTIAGNFLVEITNPTFITKRYIEIGFVKEGWTLCANLAGIFLVLALIAIGVAVALRMIKNPGEALIKFVTAAVLIPFTPVIAGFMIDFSNIFTFTFFRTGAAQGFFNGINLLQSAVDSFSTMFAPGAGFLDGVGGMLGALIFLALFGIMMGLTLGRFGIMFFARYVALWIIIILSPLAFCFLALSVIPSKEFPPFEFFSKLGSYHKTWWENLFGWATIGILGSFFLYIAGMASNALATTDIDLIDSGWFYELIGENLLPYIIPLFILYMGYNLTIEWAPAAAKQVVDGVEGAVKGAVMIAGVAVGGAAMKGAGSLAASKTGQAVASSMQAKGASMMAKPGQKTLGSLLNQAGTKFGAFGVRARKEYEGTFEKKMSDLGGIGDGGKTLSGVKFPQKHWGNEVQVDALQKGKEKGLLEAYIKEYDKKKIKLGDDRMFDILGFATGQNDRKSIEKLFKENPALLQSNDIRALKAKGFISDAKTKDNMEFLSKDTLSKLSGLDDKQKGVAKDAMNPTKLLGEKDLDNAGITGANKDQILKTRDSIISLATKSAQKVIAESFKQKDISNIETSSITDVGTLKNLKENTTPEGLLATLKRVGASAYKDFTTGMDRSRLEALFKNKGVSSLDPETLKEMLPDAFKSFNRGGSNVVNSMLSNGNATDINEMIELIKQDPNVAKIFFQTLGGGKKGGGFIKNINSDALGSVLQNESMIRGVAEYGNENSNKSYFSEAGPEAISNFNNLINQDEGFRRTVIQNNPNMITGSFTPNASMSDVKMQSQNSTPENPTYVKNFNEAKQYVNYYRQQYGTPEQPINQNQNQGQRQNQNQNQNNNRQQQNSQQRANQQNQNLNNIRSNVSNNPSPISNQNQGQRIGGYQSLAQDIDEDNNSDQGFAKTKYE